MKERIFRCVLYNLVLFFGFFISFLGMHKHAGISVLWFIPFFVVCSGGYIIAEFLVEINHFFNRRDKRKKANGAALKVE